MQKWPIRYIKSARTDEELHRALKRLAVPTELDVYPAETHGIPDPRNQLVIDGGDGVDGLLRAREAERNSRGLRLPRTLEDEVEKAKEEGGQEAKGSRSWRSPLGSRR